jgi:hypothetical protein
MWNDVRHLALLAKGVVTLVHLFGGRFAYGLGAGDNTASSSLARKVSLLLPRSLAAKRTAECTETQSNQQIRDDERDHTHVEGRGKKGVSCRQKSKIWPLSMNGTKNNAKKSDQRIRIDQASVTLLE